MKRKMLLFTLALPVIFIQHVQAQTASRLVGVAHLGSNGASFTPKDSTVYNYSGGRGGDMTHTLKYDNATSWDFLGDTAYSNANMYLQTFDANNNITSSTSSYWSGTGWVLSNKNIYYYDTAGKDTATVQQVWGGSAWVPVAKDVYTYIGSKVVVDQYQVWDGLTLSYTPNSQKNYYYDPVTGLKLNVTNITWVSGVPTNVDEYSYTYSGTNLLTTNYSTWNGASWVNGTLTTNTYDSSGNMTNTLYQTYSTSTGSWVNNTLHLFSNFTVSHSAQIDIQQTWDTTGGGTWNNLIQYTKSYNGFNQITNSIGESWNVGGGFELALNDPMTNYYYNTYTPSSNVSVKPVVAATNDANVYPVPAVNTLHVDLNWSDAQAAKIAIYDMQGKVVNEWTSDFGTQYFSAISVNHLPSGTYFVKINGANSQIVKQFVVAH